MSECKVIQGDCLEVLRGMEDNSVDSVVCDPPYGLSNTKPGQVADVLAAWVTGDTEAVPAKRGGFMGKDWDSFVPPPAVWSECLRVLKPGGHMAVFAGARTQDLMGLSIRMAGFEIRDTLGWIYGSGFPKSMDISKAIDKKRDDNNDWKTVGSFLKRHRVSAGYATRNSFADKILRGHSSLDSAAANLSNWENGLSFPTWERWEQLKGLLGLPDDMDAEVWRLNGRKGKPGEAWEKREVVGVKKAGIATPGDRDRYTVGGSKAVEVNITAPATSDAARWDGWGTALKPAIEPIILARKPLDGTVAANVMAHGVGGLNIDACRVGTDERLQGSTVRDDIRGGTYASGHKPNPGDIADYAQNPAGRFPANVLLDEHAATEMDKQSGHLSPGARPGNTATRPKFNGATYNGGKVYDGKMDEPRAAMDSGGGASRFFPVFKYQAKAPKRERPVIVREDGTKIQHPTVKPLALMEWLVTLTTPEGGLVLDPFAGTGTTLQAARNKGFHAIGVEQDADYIQLIHARLDTATEETLFTATN